MQASYSNLAFALLGNVLSEFLHSEYSSTLFDTVIDPLHLRNTGLYLNPQQQPFAATGTPHNRKQQNNLSWCLYKIQNFCAGYNSSYMDQGYVDIGWVGPAGQLFSSVSDLSVLLKQFFAAYPSRLQQGVDQEYKFVVSPQTLREMLRPAFMNADQQSGFGTPWEMKVLDGHLLRGKGGNINGFSSEVDMVPEMKLGVIALCNYNLDASLFTLGTLEIMIPALKAWMSSSEAEQFRPALPHNVGDYVGTYLLTETLPLFTVYTDNDTQALMVVSRLNGFYGRLTWIEANSTSFVYNDLHAETDSCWTTTLGAEAGMILRFTLGGDGNVDGVTLDGNDWGVVFPKSSVPAQQQKHWPHFKKETDNCPWESHSDRRSVHLSASWN